MEGMYSAIFRFVLFSVVVSTANAGYGTYDPSKRPTGTRAVAFDSPETH